DVSKITASAQLNIFDPSLGAQRVGGATRLAWLVTIDTYRVFVDAKTKEVFYYFRNHQSVLARRVFDVGQTVNFPGTMVIDEQAAAQVVTGSASAAALPAATAGDAMLAFTNTGLVYNFYSRLLGRNGYDD